MCPGVKYGRTMSLARAHSQQTAEHAFSLAEALVILVVLALLGGIAVPRYSGAIARQSVNGAARRVVADLGVARRRAMLTDTIQSVTFDVSADRYVLNGMKHLTTSAAEYSVDLSGEAYGVNIALAEFVNDTDPAGDPTVVFDIYGHPDSEGWVIIRKGAHVAWISLDGETGRATMSRLRPPEAPIIPELVD